MSESRALARAGKVWHEGRNGTTATANMRFDLGSDGAVPGDDVGVSWPANPFAVHVHCRLPRQS